MMHACARESSDRSLRLVRRPGQHMRAGRRVATHMRLQRPDTAARVERTDGSSARAIVPVRGRGPGLAQAAPGQAVRRRSRGELARTRGSCTRSRLLRVPAVRPRPGSWPRGPHPVRLGRVPVQA